MTPNEVFKICPKEQMEQLAHFFSTNSLEGALLTKQQVLIMIIILQDRKIENDRR